MLYLAPYELEVGMQLEDGAFVDAVYQDDEGIWLETDDGGKGYVDPHRTFKVVSY